MTKESAFVKKFALLTPFHKHIFSAVKKNCRNEHLRIDKKFFKRWFPGKSYSQISINDILQVYPRVIQEGEERLAEFIANRWVLKHMNIYSFFENELKKINPQFDTITTIPDPYAIALKNAAQTQFGVVNTYIFCLFNDVAFSPSTLELLFQEAMGEKDQYIQEVLQQ